jgi:hypothetical protein
MHTARVLSRSRHVAGSIVLALAAVAAFLSASAWGQSVSLAWAPSTDPDVAGYILHYGGATRAYTNRVVAGRLTKAAISGLLPGAEYFFAATAVNSAGLESDFSNEISFSFQVPGEGVAAQSGVVQAQFSYTTNNGTITITAYSGPGGAVAIPSTINGLLVTSIREDAFDACVGLTRLTIPNNVTSIGDSAFSGTSVTDATISNSVTNIGEHAFGSCSRLTAITVDALNSFYGSLDGVLFNKNQTILIQCPGGKAGSYTIPNSVTRIGDEAFSGCASLTSVTIPNSVTCIGGGAFSGCASLTSVTIPNSVTSIGDEAFSGCTSLTNAAIPNSVTNIGAGVFENCTSVSAITVDALNSFYSSVAGVLFDKSQTTLVQYPGGKAGSYTIANGVTSIGEGAFGECAGLTNVTIANSVTNLGDWAFRDCIGLTSATIGNRLTSIGSGGFWFCTSLTNVTIPDSVTSIGEGAFGACTDLTSVTIPDSVTNIGDWAFYYCISLAWVTIGNSVTNIGDWAFDDCTNLTGVYFQGNAPTCGSSAFSGDYGTVYYLAGTTGWGPAFGGLSAFLWDPGSQAAYTTTNGTIIITGYAGPGGSLSIPGTINALPVTSIGDWAFSSGASLASVTIPDSVTNIGDYTFWGCSSLAAITVDTHNPVYSSVAGVLFDKSQTVLIQYPAGKSGTCTVPDSVTNIEAWAFADCTNLTEVFFQGNAPTCDASAFRGDSATVYYLAGTTGWGPTFAGLPAVLWDPVSQTAYTTTNGAITITGYTGPGGSVTIPGTIHSLPVASIGDYAFAYSGLTNLTIPNGVTSIGDDAFAYCTSLASVTIPHSVTNIGASVFENCTSLSAIMVDALNSFYSSVDGVLFDNSQTTLVEYPGGKAGSYTIPNGATSIGESAFDDSPNLTSVTIPNSVTNIGNGAFDDCTNLTGVYFQGNAPTCDSSAFRGDYATVYYLARTTGWGPTFAGLPAFLWDPLSQAAYTSANGAITLTGYTGPGGSVTIPSTIDGLPVTSLGDYVFSSSGLTSVRIPNSVTSIGNGAFAYCDSLTSMTIPGSVSTIGAGAFESCTNLTAVYFEGNAPAVDSSAFVSDLGASAYYLSWTTGWGASFGGLPTALWNLPAQAQFNYTTTNGTITITRYFGPGGSVTIPGTINSLPVTSIGSFAFGYASLTNVTIRNGVTSLGDDAFAYCTGLTSVTIPHSVTNIGARVFGNCASLSAITVDALDSFYSSVDGVLFDKSGATLIEYPGGKTGSYTIPNGVTSIGDWAFGSCTNLTNVTIPGSVTNIGSSVFENCTRLSAITVDALNSFYSSVDGVLFDRRQTTLIEYPGGKTGSYTIPNGVTSIGDWAFGSCTNLTNVTIPSSVTHIGNGAFDACTNLTEVYFQGNAPTCDSSAFWGDYATVYYLVGTMGWGPTFADRAAFLWDPLSQAAYTTTNGTITIAGYTGPGASVTIPGTIDGLPVTGIGDYAFAYSGLTNVTIPNSVTSLGDDAFAYCTSLASLYFQGNAPGIGWRVFANDNNAVVYYLPGTTGWGATFGGCPTMLWENGSSAIPAITLQPQSQTVKAGENATFTVAANGTPALGYQWLFNAGTIAGATMNRYIINNVQPPDAGSYSVVVSNAAGSVTSDVAVLTVGGAQFNALNLPPMTLIGAASDPSRNTYVLGLFTDTLNIGGKSLVSQGGTDYVLAQYRPDGTVGWAISFGTPQDEAAVATLAVMSDGVFVSGTTLGGIEMVDTANNTVHTGYTSGGDGFLFCFSLTGVALWQASITAASAVDVGSAVAFDATGNTYWAGVFNGCCPSPGGATLTGGDGTSVALTTPSYATGFLTKLSPAGTPLWVATGYNGEVEFNQVAVDSSGAVVVAGYSRSWFSRTPMTLTDAGGNTWSVNNPGYQSSFAAKFDTSGFYQWSVCSTASPGGLNYVVWQCMTAATNGGTLLAGSYNTTGFSLSGVDGVAQSLPAPDGQDGFVAELSSSGSVKWLTQIGGSGTEVVDGISLSSSGGITAAGLATAGLSLASTNIAGLGGTDGFVAMLDQNGNVTNAFVLGGPGNDEVINVIAGNSGYDLIAGNESGGFEGLGVQIANAGPFVLTASPALYGPQIQCPIDINTNMAPGQCQQTVSFAATLTAGSPAPVVTYQLAGNPITSPYAFPVGQNTVSVTATNIAGTNTCNFIVTVVDNDPPVAGFDELSTSQGSPAVLEVAQILRSCASPSGQPLSITAAASPTANGAMVTLAGGRITYAPPASFSGQDTLNYTLSDGCGTAQGAIAMFVSSTNLSPLTYKLSTPISGSLRMGIWDLYGPITEGGRQPGINGSVDVSFETLTETVYLDPAAGTIRQIGFIAVAPSATNILISLTETQHIPGQFPTLPQTVSGNITVTLNLVDGGIHFDTGPQPITWDVVNQVYTFGADLTNTIPFRGSYYWAAGGQIFAGTFSYVVENPEGWLHSFAFSQVSVSNYPASLFLSGLGDDGGPSAYLPVQSMAANPNVPPPTIVADVLAADGFHLRLAPGTDLNGEWRGYWFSWGCPPVTAVNVNEVNVAPVLPVIPAQTVLESALLSVTNTASEPNPHATLSYRLLAPPDGMAVSTDGIVTWSPQQSQSPSTNLVRTVVTSSTPYDPINPHLSATNSFVVLVLARQRLGVDLLNGHPQLAWSSSPGSRFQVQYRTGLDAGAWLDLGAVITATGSTCQYEDGSSSSATARYYRVLLLP